MQIQKAAFADGAQPARRSLLARVKLLDQVFFLSLGMILGFLLTPIPGGLTIGSLAIGGRAIVLLPAFLLGWITAFLLWAVPLHKLAGQLYMAHRSDQLPKMKLKWLTRISIAGLLPIFGAMTWTQMTLSSLVGFSDDFSDPKFWTTGLVSVAVAWILALPAYSLIWGGGWFWMKAHGWLNSELDDNSVPAWAISPLPYHLPEPPSVVFPIQTRPPPL